ncbi:MAG: hypothetical protein WCK51_04120 [Armatimonadota bacterium]
MISRLCTALGILGLSLFSVAQVRPPVQDGAPNRNNPTLNIAKLDQLSTNELLINWRGNGTASFSAQTAPRLNGSTKFTLAIWGFGVPKEGQHSAGGREPAATGIKQKVGRIVGVLDLGTKSGNFKVDVKFSEFAPFPSTLITFSPPAGNTTQAIATAQLAQDRKDALQDIAQNGTTDYYAQLTSADGGASNWVKIQYGEPVPKPRTTSLEVQTVRSTPEFPEERWGTAKEIVAGESLLSFRWATASEATYALVQVVDGDFPSSWALWANAKNEVYRADLPTNKLGKKSFTIEVSKLKISKKPATFKVRVIPLLKNGDLAGMPSPETTLTEPLAPVAKADPNAKKLTFTTELVGWEPAYTGNWDDKYRFVVASELSPKIVGDVTKIIGKEPARGDKLYLPPKEPKPDDPWYKKVYKSIATVLDFIYKSWSNLNTIFSTIEFNLKEALKKGVNEVAEKCGASKASVEKAWGVALAPLKISNEVGGFIPTYVNRGSSFIKVRMLDDLGVKDPQARRIMGGNIEGAVVSWAWDNSYLAVGKEEIQGLAPDPDFMIHTAVAYFRVRTNRVTGLASDYREQGPTISLKVGAFAKASENIGGNVDYRDLFEKTISCPTMAPDEELIIAVPMDYHWSHQSKYQTWWETYNQNQKTRYTLNGNSVFGQPVTSKWGKTQ